MEPLSLVCFSPYVPYPGIDHAGGGLFQSYIEATRDLGHRLLVAPNWPINDGDSAHSLDQVELVAPVPARGDRIHERLHWQLVPHRAPPSIRRGLLAAGASALRTADVVEYQWEEMAALLPAARRLAPRARHVVFLHDVTSQSLARKASTGSSRDPRARIHVRTARWDEARIARTADSVIVLSDKDAGLLPNRENVVVARPVVRVRPQPARAPRSGAPRAFVFVAAFGRDENVEAASWLCREVWPRIRERLADAQLRFAGRGSDTRLGHLLEPTAGVSAVGYVSDLDAVYAEADVALIPLLRGAGVKLKTLEAMITATPAVSTSIGAEGIDRASDFIEIADTPEEFAQAAVRAASDLSGEQQRRAEAGSAWAAKAHGEDQYRDALVRAITGG